MPQSKSRKIAILGYRSVDDCVPSVENASSWHSGVLHWHLFQNHPWNRNSQCLWTQGKSSLTIQFVEGQFVDSYDPTIENTFTKLITVNGQEYHLQLVDTAGQVNVGTGSPGELTGSKGWKKLRELEGNKEAPFCRLHFPIAMAPSPACIEPILLGWLYYISLVGGE
ncbi:GTP-binding protein Rheb isoform X6 [Myotis myotis]|uniref:GTP-binding protein Rheb isoform X6 n=1 Tax=Myotis myotis TaxID=51298 RepID=UPI0017485231|nr:GTP-binding protein Rheb isoform X6 [Myotis myotis]